MSLSPSLKLKLLKLARILLRLPGMILLLLLCFHQIITAILLLQSGEKEKSNIVFGFWIVFQIVFFICYILLTYVFIFEILHPALYIDLEPFRIMSNLKPAGITMLFYLVLAHLFVIYILFVLNGIFVIYSWTIISLLCFITLLSLINLGRYYYDKISKKIVELDLELANNRTLDQKIKNLN